MATLPENVIIMEVYNDADLSDPAPAYNGEQSPPPVLLKPSVAGTKDFVTVVSVEDSASGSVASQGQKDHDNYVTLLEVDETPSATEEVLVYRLPGERLGMALKFVGGTAAGDKVSRVFIQSITPESPASRAQWKISPIKGRRRDSRDRRHPRHIHDSSRLRHASPRLPDFYVDLLAEEDKKLLECESDDTGSSVSTVHRKILASEHRQLEFFGAHSAAVARQTIAHVRSRERILNDGKDALCDVLGLPSAIAPPESFQDMSSPQYHLDEDICEDTEYRLTSDEDPESRPDTLSPLQEQEEGSDQEVGMELDRRLGDAKENHVAAAMALDKLLQLNFFCSSEPTSRHDDRERPSRVEDECGPEEDCFPEEEEELPADVNEQRGYDNKSDRITFELHRPLQPAQDLLSYSKVVKTTEHCSSSTVVIRNGLLDSRGSQSFFETLEKVDTLLRVACQ
ncbi:hypothetical protein MRX96_027143 [Rhipicephalus microplus]